MEDRQNHEVHHDSSLSGRSNFESAPILSNNITVDSVENGLHLIETPN